MEKIYGTLAWNEAVGRDSTWFGSDRDSIWFGSDRDSTSFGSHRDSTWFGSDHDSTWFGSDLLQRINMFALICRDSF
jgi:hypothetical protein